MMKKKDSKSKNILVTGGAGYIGSHLIPVLEKAGYNVFVFDNLTNSVSDLPSGKLIRGDISEVSDLRKLFKSKKFLAIFHLASLIDTRSSPEINNRYYDVNVIGTLNLLSQMVENGTKYLVFLSTCGVYGEQSFEKISEKVIPSPISTYAQTKLIAEKIIRFFGENYNIKSVILRLTNAAGVDARLLLMRRMLNKKTILVKGSLSALKNKAFILNGKNYKTPDGTCIRDYIHVKDLAEVQVNVLEKLIKGVLLKEIYNISSGIAHSNLDIVKRIKKISGSDFKIKFGPNVQGDIGKIVLDSSLFRRDFNWKPRYSGIDNIIKDTLSWFRKNA